jgi:hypothetical protein
VLVEPTTKEDVNQARYTAKSSQPFGTLIDCAVAGPANKIKTRMRSEKPFKTTPLYQQEKAAFAALSFSAISYPFSTIYGVTVT